jgi:hypothetical protein
MAISSAEKCSVFTKESLVRHWGIGLDSAHQTLRTTTLRGVRSFLNPTNQRVSTHHPHLAFLTMRRKKMYMDTSTFLVMSVRSKRLNMAIL